jgi:small subunit ribosomal protein S5
MTRENTDTVENISQHSEGSLQSIEKVVHINRCAKVVKGGRRFSFSAAVVTGDQNGSIGVGLGKANEVPDAVRKATEHARKTMRRVQLKGTTIPHEVIGKSDGGVVLLKPATPGTGVKAAGGVRAVLVAAGVKDVITKQLRSNNPMANILATIDALEQLRTYAQIKKIRNS